MTSHITQGYKIQGIEWGRHSSVDSSVPNIQRARVQIPSTPSTLLYSQICTTFVIVLRIEPNKQKEASLAHI